MADMPKQDESKEKDSGGNYEQLKEAFPSYREMEAVSYAELARRAAEAAKVRADG